MPCGRTSVRRGKPSSITGYGLIPLLIFFEKLDSRGAMFSAWSKAERNRRFASLLSSFDLMFGIEGVQQASGSVSPRELN